MDSVKKLLHLDCSGRIEKKQNLSYLSWSFAWAEVLKNCPTATYQIHKFDNLPYVFDPKTGYMCFTSVTIDDITHEMWLPVMDGANKAMKDVSYTYKTKYAEKTVESASMFDINKTIMRCLVKNLAMFGLGLYIYAGEDLPEVDETAVLEAKKKQEEELAARKAAAKKCEDDLRSCKTWEEFTNKFEKLTPKQQEHFTVLMEELKLELVK
jgi:hypothetical protein